MQLTYFDGGKGSFSLVYDSFDHRFRASPAVPPGTWRPALQIQLKGTGQWVTAEGESQPTGNMRTEIAMCPGSKGWREYQFQWLLRYVDNYL